MTRAGDARTQSRRGESGELAALGGCQWLEDPREASDTLVWEVGGVGKTS